MHMNDGQRQGWLTAIIAVAQLVQQSRVALAAAPEVCDLYQATCWACEYADNVVGAPGMFVIIPRNTLRLTLLRNTRLCQ